ncbi:MAG: polysaccharide deacetylase family protein [Bacilli bacterium]|nr:polysaccharide deacetylase family protein [bacterium]MDY2697818.1 polysaccharide deacetylase family protein [Bacilli bacterium]MEE0014890.1 polysaccharide deacetylase family protein [Bacilli bacterium]
MNKKKVIQVISVTLLMLFSFFYTNKSIELIRENDPIMKQIKETNMKYKVNPVNATIIGNKIIPGKSGKEIDYQKTYAKMKKYGTYNETLTVLKEIEPAVSVDDYYDKYIVQGNTERKNVSLVFKTDTISNLLSILNILNQKNIPATFFVDGLLLENNTSLFETMTQNNHELEILSYDNKYDEIYFDSALNYLSSITKREGKYCYAEYDQKEVIELCSKLKLHTIIPTVKTTTMPYKEIKDKLYNSAIISLPLSTITEEQLPAIIDYIKQKGYTFLSLEELLSENDEK